MKVPETVVVEIRGESKRYEVYVNFMYGREAMHGVENPAVTTVYFDDAAANGVEVPHIDVRTTWREDEGAE